MPEDIETLRQEVWAVFKPMQTVGLATVEDGAPRVRPVTVIHHERNLWVATGTGDAKVGQLRANPDVEFYLLVGERRNPGSLRARGRAEFVSDPVTRKTAAKMMPYFSMFWKTPDDPAFTLLRLHVDSFEYMRPGTMDIKRFSAWGAT